LVEIADDGSLAVERVPLGVGWPLRTIEGLLEELLRDPALEEARPARLRVRLTDENLPLQAMARLRPRFPHIAELRHLPPERPDGGGEARAARIAATLTPLQRSLAFFAEQQGRDPSPAEAALLGQALEAARTGGER
jgi:exonuclease SbcD